MFHLNVSYINLLLGIVLIISGCKYDIYKRNDTRKLNNTIIHICSYDPYGYITMAIKRKLNINSILYTDCKKNSVCKQSPYIFLYITHISERCIKTALFQNGEVAEYQMIFSLIGKIKVENKKPVLFNIKTSRSFFNDPLAILSNSVKKEHIRQIIYEEASEELLNQLFFLYNKKNS